MGENNKIQLAMLAVKVKTAFFCAKVGRSHIGMCMT